MAAPSTNSSITADEGSYPESSWEKILELLMLATMAIQSKFLFYNWMVKGAQSEGHIQGTIGPLLNRYGDHPAANESHEERVLTTGFIPNLSDGLGKHYVEDSFSGAGLPTSTATKTTSL